MASNSGVQANNLPRAALVTDLIGLTGAMGDTALISLARLGVLVGAAATYTRAGYATKAALLADLTPPANTIGEVFGDPVAANNGYYLKAGAGGTGGWTYVKALPEADFATAAEAIEGLMAGRALSPAALSAALDADRGPPMTDHRYAAVWGVGAGGLPAQVLTHDGALRRLAPSVIMTSEVWETALVDLDGVVLWGKRWDDEVAVNGPVYETSEAYDAVLLGASPARVAYVLADDEAVRVSRIGEDPVAARVDGAALVYRTLAGTTVTTTREDLTCQTQLSAGRTSLHHLLLLGQSLGKGTVGAVTTAAEGAGRYMMFRGGIRVPLEATTPVTSADTVSLAEAVEFDTESPCRALMEALGAGWADDGTAFLASNHALGGAYYSQIKRGTVPFANAVEAMRRGHLIARLNGLAYAPSAHMVHGEADRAATATAYAGYLTELQADLTAAYRAITGATDEVVLYVSQVAGWTAYVDAAGISHVPTGMAQAATASPGKIVLVGPRYTLATDSGGTHLLASASRQLGDMHAQAQLRHRAGRPSCLRALPYTRAGATLTIPCAVPTAPIVRDTSLVTNPGGWGLVYAQTGGTPATVVNAVAEGSTIVVTLSANPGAPTAESLRIALDGVPLAHGGPTTGPRACFRDSTPGVDATGMSRACYLAAGEITPAI
ncbi:hypothetical protein V5F53_11020 [Xanthobacter sp. V4C-4]|uniref:hypothetical protein n=1 Tax=Xanthobacter cornucopiae TaxID=3119924 RepID=UPI0037284C8B